MSVMKTTSWGITHQAIDDILMINIYGMFDRIIFKSYLSTILQKTEYINSFIFQMSSIYVPTENDFSELIECVRHLTGIKRIAIIASSKSKPTNTDSIHGYFSSENMGVKICFNGQSAIDWVTQ